MRRNRVPGAQPKTREQEEAASTPEPPAGASSSGSLCAGCAWCWARGFVLPSLQAAAPSRSSGNMQRAWILLTLGLVACVSAESVSGLGGDRAPFRGVRGREKSAEPAGIRECRWGFSPPTPPGSCRNKCARSSTPFRLPSPRKAPLAGVAPRSLGMRARESQFCQTAEAPEVTTNFFALVESCCVSWEGPKGKGWLETGTQRGFARERVLSAGSLRPRGDQETLRSLPLHSISHASSPTRLNASSGER